MKSGCNVHSFSLLIIYYSNKTTQFEAVIKINMYTYLKRLNLGFTTQPSSTVVSVIK